MLTPHRPVSLRPDKGFEFSFLLQANFSLKEIGCQETQQAQGSEGRLGTSAVSFISLASGSPDESLLEQAMMQRFPGI